MSREGGRASAAQFSRNRRVSVRVENNASNNVSRVNSVLYNFKFCSIPRLDLRILRTLRDSSCYKGEEGGCDETIV
jgi:hypothetical protein